MRTQKAQLLPADTNNATLYQVGTRASGAHGQGPTGEGVVRVCNLGSSALTCRIFHNWGGTTFGDAQALYDDVTVLGNETRPFAVAALRHEGEAIGVRSSSASGLTFTYEAD
jgi:hypothetical protein